METVNPSSEIHPYWGRLEDMSFEMYVDMYDEFVPLIPAVNPRRPPPVVVADLPSVQLTSDDMVSLSHVCSICMEDFVGGGGDRTAKRVPCGHVYHADCISSWLSHSDSCPLCRSSVSSSSSSSSGQ